MPAVVGQRDCAVAVDFAVQRNFVVAQSNSAVMEPVEHERERARPERADHTQRKRQPRYNVILWNDNDHSYEYVINMMKKLFGHTTEKGFEIAKEVDTQGRAVCLTTTLEHAELKRDQIHAFGADATIKNCKGSMSSSIEPAE